MKYKNIVLLIIIILIMQNKALSQQTIAARFPTPEGYVRETVSDGSYAAYLRNLPLKPIGAKVHYYNGDEKPNRGVYEAVVNLPIGRRDLHQCADAIMRLRAEYLWRKGRFNDIQFNLTNGFKVRYAEWMKGRRIVVQGNKTYWNNRVVPSNKYEDFWKYMEFIFSYAGTLSLSHELPFVPIEKMQIGDLLLQGGSPGHAVVVVDMAVSAKTKEKIYLLAQSYMPAQEIQILKNNQSDAIAGCWYKLKTKGNIYTPEWVFKTDNLRRMGN